MPIAIIHMDVPYGAKFRKRNYLMHDSDPSLDARRDIIVETKALILLSRFPSTDLALQANRMYSLSCAIDGAFDQCDIPINELLPTARSFIEELEHRYGSGGCRIGEARPHLTLSRRV
jgi:hypothetical protein